MNPIPISFLCTQRQLPEARYLVNLVPQFRLWIGDQQFADDLVGGGIHDGQYESIAAILKSR